MMAMRREVKIRLASKKETQKRLSALGWSIGGLVFRREYEFAVGGGFFLQAEKAGRHSLFAVKIQAAGGEARAGERRASRSFRLGVGIRDADGAAEKLGRLGLAGRRVVERYDQTWIHREDAGLRVNIDSLPHGDYLRLSGRPAEVDRILCQLEMADAESIAHPYPQEYGDWCRLNGMLEKRDLLFGERESS